MSDQIDNIGAFLFKPPSANPAAGEFRNTCVGFKSASLSGLGQNGRIDFADSDLTELGAGEFAVFEIHVSLGASEFLMVPKGWVGSGCNDITKIALGTRGEDEADAVRLSYVTGSQVPPARKIIIVVSSDGLVTICGTGTRLTVTLNNEFTSGLYLANRSSVGTTTEVTSSLAGLMAGATIY